MNRVLSAAAVLVIALILVWAFVKFGPNVTGPVPDQENKTERLADYKGFLRPLYIDFEKPNWEEGLYLAEYSSGEDVHYRTNFEPAAIKQNRYGLQLVISEAQGDKNWDWDAAEIQLKRKTGYGRYEVVMKPAPGSGLISSFFTYTGAYFGDPHDEIDIEFLGKNREEVEFNVFTAGQSLGGVRHELGYVASEEFHHYAFDWYPGSIIFYVDGKVVHEVTGAPEDLPRHAGRLMINFWTGTMTDWHGDPEFESGVSADYLCIAYRPMGDTSSPLCAHVSN